MIAMSRDSKGPQNLKIVERLNKCGSSWFDTYLGLEKQHHRGNTQLSANDKRLILKYKTNIDTSSVYDTFQQIKSIKNAAESHRSIGG